MMETQVFGAAAAAERPIGQSIFRGMMCRCPNCNEGKLFNRYLKVADRCDNCGEDLHHHRADDLPAYLVVTIVGHIMVGVYMGLEKMFDLGIWTHLAYLGPLTLAMTLAMLPPVKGGVVGLQWACRMHGFSGEKEALETHPELQNS